MLDRTTQYPGHLAKLVAARLRIEHGNAPPEAVLTRLLETLDRKSTRLNSSHTVMSYAVFCLKKTRRRITPTHPSRGSGADTPSTGVRTGSRRCCQCRRVHLRRSCRRVSRRNGIAATDS